MQQLTLVRTSVANLKYATRPLCKNFVSPLTSTFHCSSKEQHLYHNLRSASWYTSLQREQLQRLCLAIPLRRSGVRAFNKTAAAMASSNDAGSGHKHVNRLAKEQSPYLLQHAHNPVDWFPWGEEAFEKAKAEDKLIFLSVGYSTCHWCHVMEVESFENEEVAKLLNESFVSIKVDREERPDVDKVYMTYVQATQGGGGWPMSVFLTPDLLPVLGGTYFPPEDKYGRIGFKSLLKRVDAVWKSRREELLAGAKDAINQLIEATQVSAKSDQLEKGFADKVITKCAKQLADRYDAKLGGFGDAPKFPRPSEINLMFHHYKRLKDAKKESDAAKALTMATFTLDTMGRGGMHDHVGGGFHRYSVDEYWHVPHFEKMLYDQGQLANAYLDSFSITGNGRYAILARDILDYLRRDMTHPEGGIYSAEDADSLEVEVDPRKKEGAFYVWTQQEIEEVLGPEHAKIFSAHYYVKAKGNCDLSPMSDPHREFVGKNVLIEVQSLKQTAEKFHLPEEEVAKILADSRKKLHEKRSQRPRPHLDDKVIVSWNGLAISAFARASTILKIEPPNMQYLFPVDGCDPSEYLTAAARAATFIREKLYDPASKTLRRSYREKPSAAAGFIDDYAFLINGLLDLHEAGGDPQWLRWALDLQATQDELFLDKKGGGYFSVPEGDNSILLRMKEDYDGAEPSGNSLAVSNLARLSHIVEGQQTQDFLRQAELTVAVFGDRLTKLPLTMPQMCCSLNLLSAPAKRQVIIAGRKGAEDTASLLYASFSVFEPLRLVLQVDDQDDGDREFWQEHNKMVLQMAHKTKEGHAAAYICQNFTCQAPTSDPEKVQSLLKESAQTEAKVSTFDIGAAMRRK